VDYDPTAENVAASKQIIAEHTDTPVEQQRLVFQGKALNDDYGRVSLNKVPKNGAIDLNRNIVPVQFNTPDGGVVCVKFNDQGGAVEIEAGRERFEVIFHKVTEERSHRIESERSPRSSPHSGRRAPSIGGVEKFDKLERHGRDFGSHILGKVHVDAGTSLPASASITEFWKSAKLVKSCSFLVVPKLFRYNGTIERRHKDKKEVLHLVEASILFHQGCW